MRKYLLLTLCIFTGCTWIDNLISKNPQTEKLDTVKTAINHYNSYNEQAYADMFSENVNYFVSNGLGTTRFATGKDNLKRFNSGVFRAKKNVIFILDIFAAGNWVFVHQRTKTPGGTVEASVGYHIQDNKIADVMVVGETRIE